jgi:hypothetical protein
MNGECRKYAEKRNAYTVLAGKPTGKRQMCRPSHMWETLLRNFSRKGNGRSCNGCIWRRTREAVECPGHGNEQSGSKRIWEAVECSGHDNKQSGCAKFLK